MPCTFSATATGSPSANAAGYRFRFSTSIHGSRSLAGSASSLIEIGTGGTHFTIPSSAAKSTPALCASARSTPDSARGRRAMPCDSSPRSRIALTRLAAPASFPVRPRSAINASGSTACSGMQTANSPVR
ncbi:hypothetical protein K530_48100 [Streptomyces noursei CCRC 11814]|nr:hypothetical protein K530_48100 [Streptomyces noursei CCRC 11814]